MHYKNTQYLKLFRTFLGILVGLSFVTIRQSEAAVSNPSEAAFLAACGIKTPPSSSPIKEDGDVSERWKWRDEQASHRSYMSWAFDADSSANRNPRYLNPRCEELILSRIADQKGADHDYVFDRCERVRDKIYHFTRRGGGRRDGGSLRNDFLRLSLIHI